MSKRSTYKVAHAQKTLNMIRYLAITKTSLDGGNQDAEMPPKKERNVDQKMGIRKFNITIADIHSGARFPADCTNRADVAAADPRQIPVTYSVLVFFSFCKENAKKLLRNC